MFDRPLWQKVAAIMALAAIVAWAFYNFNFKKRLRTAAELKTNLAAVEKEIDIIKPGNIILKGSLPIKEQIDRQLKEISKKIPSELDIPYLLQAFIVNSSKDLKIDYNSLQPLAPVQEGMYKKVPIMVEMSTDFSNLNLYLARLEKLPITIRIDQMDILKNPVGMTLEVKLALSSFVLPGGSSRANTAKINFAQIPYTDPFFSSGQKIVVPTKRTTGEAVTEKSARGGSAFGGKKAVSLPHFKGIYKGEDTKAFVDNDIAGVGDVVSGFKIRDIKEKYIVVSKGRISYTLKLGR